jgi:Flp pilus assembly protein TadD
MRKPGFALHAIAGALLLFGCATPSLVNSPRIEPVVNLQHGSSQADGYFELGRFFQGQGRIGQAIVAYRKALAMDDRLAEAHNALGALYGADGAFDRAFAEFGAAITIDPTAAHFYSNLGYAQYLAGRPAEAALTLEKAVALDPANARARNNLGIALAASGEAEGSRVAFARAAEFAAAPPPSGAPSTAAPIDVRSDTVPAQVDSPTWSTAATPLLPVQAPTGFERTVPNDSGAAIGTHLTQIGLVRLSSTAAMLPLELGAVTSLPSAASASLAPETRAGTIVSEWPTGLSVVEQGPNVVELKWTGTQLLARPAVAGDEHPARAYGLEVANGNGITGMARRVGGLLADVGLPKARLTNQQPYAQQVTEIQFRDGHAETATSLSSRLPSHPTAVPSERLRADIDVRLVLGKDLPGNVALVEPEFSANRVASTPPRTLTRMP